MGTVVQILEAPAGYSVGSSIPELFVAAGTTQPPVWSFTNPGTNISINFPTRAINYASGNLVVDIDWYSIAGSTTGTVTWLVSVTSIAAGAAESIEAATGGTQASVASTVNATAKGLTRATVTVTSLDGMATGSDIWVNVQRSVSDTSMAGSAGLKSITLSYSDGLTGTPGSGDFVGPASSTSGDLVTFSGTTGKLGADSGILAANVVQGPASSNTGGIPSFNGTTGKLLSDSGLVLGNLVSQTTFTSVSGNLPQFSNTTANRLADSGVVAANVVTGPASVAATGNLASYNGTTGKLVQDSGVAAASVVVGPASAVSGNIATYNGTTGKLVQDSGVSATAHAARHNPAGADPLFTGTWAANDEPRWNGSAWVQKMNALAVLSGTVVITGASPAASVLGDVTGLSFALPRAGTYFFEHVGTATMSGTAAFCFVAVNFTGTVTSVAGDGFIHLPWAAAGFDYCTQNANNALVGTAAAGGTYAAGVYGCRFGGCIVVSTTGTLSFRMARSNVATVMTWAAGSCFRVTEV